MTRATLPTHPGTPRSPRRIALRAGAARHDVVAIRPGEELFDFAERVVAGFGGQAALLAFGDVPLRSAAVHVPEDDPTGRQIMRYGPARIVDAPCTLVAAQMAVGRGDDGVAVLHGHGHLRLGGDERLGGHLARGGCVVAAGAAPVPVRVTLLEGLRLAPLADSETGFTLLSPAPVDSGAADEAALPPSDAPAAGGWLLRLKPDEDLVDSLEALLAASGGARLRVAGAVGSLMHATLGNVDGATARVDGPGVEIVSFGGELLAGDAASSSSLQLTVADTDGQVHAGRPVAGGNPICVTIELFVEVDAGVVGKVVEP